MKRRNIFVIDYKLIAIYGRYRVMKRWYMCTERLLLSNKHHSMVIVNDRHERGCLPKDFGKSKSP